MFPIAPLHNSIDKTLKPAFERALTRIFRICDKDRDGTLDDDELADFQRQVFKANLTKNHITAFKEVLVLECPDFDEQQAQKGVTFEAFKTFMRVLMRKLKMEVCWTVLRHFNYDDNLEVIKKVCWDDHSIDDSVL